MNGWTCLSVFLFAWFTVLIIYARGQRRAARFWQRAYERELDQRTTDITAAYSGGYQAGLELRTSFHTAFITEARLKQKRSWN